MTNEEIKERIPYIREQVEQNETEYRVGAIDCFKYWENNFYLMEEVNNLIEQAEENNRREMFDDLMGNPLKIIERWFR